MKYVYFIPLSLIIISCSHTPQEGDWYEHKGTRERVKIEKIDTERQLFNYHLEQSNKDKTLGTINEEYHSRWSGFTSEDDSSDSKCVLWHIEQQETTSYAINITKMYYIATLDSFQKNWIHIP